MGWGLEAIETRIAGLASSLRQRLAALPGVAVQDRGARKSGIVSFSIAGRDPKAVKAALAAQGINLSTTSLASTRLDLEARGIPLMNRLGVHYYNSEAELDRLVAALAALSR